ncbi:hypothetical protein MRY82_09995 [bacterium]|nr:hypothetical protein [bacterium]
MSITFTKYPSFLRFKCFCLCLSSFAFAQSNAVHDKMKSLNKPALLKKRHIQIQADHTGIRFQNHKYFQLNARNQLIVRKDRFLNKLYNDQQDLGTHESALAFEFINESFTGTKLSSHFINYKKRQAFNSFNFRDTNNRQQQLNSFTIAQELTQELGNHFRFSLLAGVAHCNDSLSSKSFITPTSRVGLSYSADQFISSINYSYGPDNIDVLSPFEGAQINESISLNTQVKLSKRFNLKLDCQHIKSRQMLDAQQRNKNIVLARASLSYKIKSKLRANVHYRLVDQGLNGLDSYQGTKTSFSLSYAAF